MSAPSLLAQARSFNRSARLFLLATLLDGAVYSFWGLFFNFYILGRGFDRQFLGLVTTVTSLAALTLGLPLGRLSDRLGRKRAMILGVVVYVAGAAVEVLALDSNLILAAAFLNGAGGTLFYLSQAPFMMQTSTPENRTLLFSLNFGLVTLMGSVGNLLAGQLPAWFGNWLGVPTTSAPAYQAVLLLSVALSTLTLLPLVLLREPADASAQPDRAALLERSNASSTPAPIDKPADWPSPAGNSPDQASLWRVATRRITLLLSLPNLLIGFGAAILIPYMNLFFRERFAMPDQTLGVLFSLSALLTGVGSILAPRLAQGAGGRIRAVVLTQTMSLVFLLALGFSPFVWLAGFAFLARGMLMNMAVPLYSAFAMEQVPETEQATVNSVKELFWQVGWAVGPYISTVVQESYGFSPLFLATAALYALAAAATWRLFAGVERK